MIIQQIIGGLGNQMFQYAAARSVALQKNVQMKLDISGFIKYKLYNFELQRVFNCPVEISNSSEVKSILGWSSPPIIRRIISSPYLSSFQPKNFILEPHFNYWKDLENIPSNAYLMGYWQSEKYFSQFASQIKRDFSFKEPLQNKNLYLKQQIEGLNAVSLHIRRGDYVSNTQATAVHGLCSIEYYLSAIRYIAERVEKPTFFIFSDDILWVKKYLKIDFPHIYIENNTNYNSYNDMRLMSLCDHNIIANSSFSWWGAWLNSNENKIVVAPFHWFAKKTDVSDLLPSSWIKL